MVKIIISTNSTKCRRCKRQTFKIEHKKGADPNRFYLTFNELMCAYCGYVYTGELSGNKRKKLEVKEEDYQKMLNQHKNYLENQDKL